MRHNRSFLRLWFVTIVTALGIELFTVTVIVTIFEQSGSTLQAAGVMVARFLPAFLLGPIAGIFVDRYPRKQVLIWMDLIRVLLVGGAIWLLSGNTAVPIFATYAILAGLAAAEAFHQPARLALIPSLVPHEQLVRANSFILVSRQVALAISFTVGGWLILNFPLGQISWSIIVLFFLSIGAAAFLQVPKRKEENETTEQESLKEAFVSGISYLRHHPIARPLTIMEAIEHLPHGIWTSAIMLAFTFQALNGDASDWGFQSSGYFSGMIIGSLIALSMNNWLRRHPGWVIIANACLSGIFTIAFAMSQAVWFSVVLALFFGPPSAIRDVAQDALLQGTVEEKQLGRVYATREMLRSIIFVLAGLFFAWLSDLIPIRLIYVIGGILYLITAVYAFSNKALRESKMET